MIIEEKEFRLTKIKNGVLFTLEFLEKVNEGKENERDEFKIVAHGIPFEDCVKSIVGRRMSLEETLSLSEYVDTYKKISDEIILLFKNKLNGI